MEATVDDCFGSRKGAAGGNKEGGRRNQSPCHDSYALVVILSAEDGQTYLRGLLPPDSLTQAATYNSARGELRGEG